MTATTEALATSVASTSLMAMTMADGAGAIAWVRLGVVRGTTDTAVTDAAAMDTAAMDTAAAAILAAADAQRRRFRAVTVTGTVTERVPLST
jgi:hypothetical protein